MTTVVQRLAAETLASLGDRVRQSRVDPDTAFIVTDVAAADIYWDRGAGIISAVIHMPDSRDPFGGTVCSTLTGPTALDIAQALTEAT